MRQLSVFEPRLTGGAVSGAVTIAHHLQLHLFADQSESVDLFLFERGFTFDVSERRYRYPDGREENVPLLRLMLDRSEEHTSELQSLMRISYAVFCLKKKSNTSRT